MEADMCEGSARSAPPLLRGHSRTLAHLSVQSSTLLCHPATSLLAQPCRLSPLYTEGVNVHLQLQGRRSNRPVLGRLGWNSYGTEGAQFACSCGFRAERFATDSQAVATTGSIKAPYFVVHSGYFFLQLGGHKGTAFCGQHWRECEKQAPPGRGVRLLLHADASQSTRVKMRTPRKTLCALWTAMPIQALWYRFAG
jgi:hypothetical protein